MSAIATGPDPDKLLTRPEVHAELEKLGIRYAKATLASAACKGRVPGPRYVLFGRRALYRWHDVLSWLKQRMGKPQTLASARRAATPPAPKPRLHRSRVALEGGDR